MMMGTCCKWFCSSQQQKQQWLSEMTRKNRIVNWMLLLFSCNFVCARAFSCFQLNFPPWTLRYFPASCSKLSGLFVYFLVLLKFSYFNSCFSNNLFYFNLFLCFIVSKIIVDGDIIILTKNVDATEKCIQRVEVENNKKMKFNRNKWTEKWEEKRDVKKLLRKFSMFLVVESFYFGH